MKTLVVLLLVLGGAAFLIHHNHLTADPSGAITAQRLAADSTLQTGMIADPSGIVLLSARK